MTEKFTMNENGNTMNISWNNHKIILETDNSKIEVKGKFNRIIKLKNLHKIWLGYNLRKNCYHALKYMIYELVYEDKTLELNWLIKKDSIEIEVLSDLKLI